MLRLADDSTYLMLGAPNDVLTSASPPGRAIVDGHETQIAVPGGSANVVEQSTRARGDRRGAARLRRPGRRPADPIAADRDRPGRPPGPWSTAGPSSGVSDDDLQPVGFDPLGAFVVAGGPGSGRTTALISIARAVRRFDPDAELHYLGRRRSLVRDALAWTEEATSPEDVQVAAKALAARVAAGPPGENGAPRIVVIVEGIADFLSGPADAAIVELIKAVKRNEHLVVAESESSTWTSSWPLLAEMKSGEPRHRAAAGSASRATPSCGPRSPASPGRRSRSAAGFAALGRGVVRVQLPHAEIVTPDPASRLHEPVRCHPEGRSGRGGGRGCGSPSERDEDDVVRVRDRRQRVRDAEQAADVARAAAVDEHGRPSARRAPAHATRPATRPVSRPRRRLPLDGAVAPAGEHRPTGGGELIAAEAGPRGQQRDRVRRAAAATRARARRAPGRSASCTRPSRTSRGPGRRARPGAAGTAEREVVVEAQREQHGLVEQPGHGAERQPRPGGRPADRRDRRCGGGVAQADREPLDRGEPGAPRPAGRGGGRGRPRAAVEPGSPAGPRAPRGRRAAARRPSPSATTASAVLLPEPGSPTTSSLGRATGSQASTGWRCSLGQVGRGRAGSAATAASVRADRQP